jgi:putative flippase GtrA
MSISVERFAKTSFFRFLIAGLANTALTYVVYLVLSVLMHYQVAYAVSYVFGICIAYAINLKYVFAGKGTARKLLQYPWIYAVQYGIGAAAMFILVGVLHTPKELAPLVVIGLSIPVSYCLNRKVLAD